MGRQRECDEVRELLLRSRAVTLTGLPGVGKTRIALKVAGDARSSYPDGVWVVDLSAERDGDLVPHAVAGVLGLREQSTRPQTEVLAEFTKDKDMLLVLDTCEHLLGACRQLINRLLAECPRVRVIATSRQPVGVAGEQVMAVEPLPVPEPGDTDPASHDAVVLFAERARALMPDTAPDPNMVARLCRLLDGIPLAVELAVCHLRALTVEQIAERLDDRFALLAGGRRTPLGRHRTLRTAVGWSHELCTPDERLLWARLTVFAGSFDVETATAICGDEWVDEVSGLIRRLVDKSLLISEGGRYRMHGAVRDYGREWLRRLGEEDMMVRRHSLHYLTLVRRAAAEWYGPDQLAWAAWARAELPDLRLALGRSRTEDTGLELAGLLWFAWVSLGELREGRHHLDRAIGPHTEPRPAHTRALWVRSWIADAQDDLDLRGQAEEALVVAMEQDDHLAAGYAARTVAVFALRAGEFDRAAAALARSSELFDRAGRPAVGPAVTEATQAMLFNAQGRYEEAAAVLQKQWARCAERGELWARAYGDRVRSQAELGRGEIGAAEAHARAALDTAWRFGDVAASATVLEQLAATAAAGGDGGAAGHLLGAARRMRTTFGLPRDGVPGCAGLRDDTERRARELVGDAVFEEELSRGLTVPPDTAVAGVRGGAPLRDTVDQRPFTPKA
ncbi:ATP-binding protein [Sinosporangium album]|uniref:ATP-binding protein n=1 Tax=Sinosporangium album TaxID=504805 RepID=UPI000B805EFB|nr:hypothetical protein [Sinosporangium album]